MSKEASITRIVILTALFLLTASTRAQECFPPGQIITDTIVSKALEGNKLGDPATRNITIYVPPGYGCEDALYPVVYLLHGFGGDERSYVDEVGEDFTVFLLDNMIASGLLKEMIIVMPNARNKYGGSFYLNSELTGNYEDYIVDDLLNYIDGKYRTIPNRNGRAIAGASMGGYGAMTLAMKHPDNFCAVASMSPPLGFDMISQKMIPEVIKENPNSLSGPWPEAKQYTGYIYALSAALSPNLDNPPFFVDLPFKYPGGELIQAVRQRWLKSDPLTMLKNDSSSLKAMNGIYIDVGDQDLPGFREAGDLFHQELLDLGIEHKYNVYHGDHSANGVERAVASLEFLSGALPASSTPVTCRHSLPVVWGAIKQR